MWKNALSRNVEGSFKKFLHPDSDADDFQNLISSSLSRDTSLLKFSPYSDQWFIMLYAKLLTDKLTSYNQTNNLLGRDNTNYQLTVKRCVLLTDEKSLSDVLVGVVAGR